MGLPKGKVKKKDAALLAGVMEDKLGKEDAEAIMRRMNDVKTGFAGWMNTRRNPGDFYIVRSDNEGKAREWKRFNVSKGCSSKNLFLSLTHCNLVPTN
jgi:hypothetical protein